LLRAVVVEDEPSSRDRLCRLLVPHSNTVLVVAHADSGPEAVRVINEQEPDLIFLDVSLPDLDGFGVLRSIRPVASVIFTTAHDEFAARAFRERAVDYLLKPIDKAQLAEAIEKLVRPSPRPGQWTELLAAMRALSDRRTRRIACRVGNSTSFVTTEEVQYFRADQGYTLVKTVGRELLVDTPLVELETRLDPADFVRIHRNTLVNLNHVASLKRLDGGGMTITLKDGTELSSSRRYAENLRNLL